MAPIALEAKIGRLLAKVPLTDHGREIPRIGKHFGDSSAAAQLSAAGLVAVKSGQQRHPRAVALGCVVELGKPQSVRRESIQPWGFDLGTIASQVGEAEIVRHDENDVGTLACSGRC